MFCLLQIVYINQDGSCYCWNVQFTLKINCVRVLNRVETLLLDNDLKNCVTSGSQTPYVLALPGRICTYFQ